MKTLTYVGLLVGLTVLAVLLAWRGIGEVADILLSSGWILLILPMALLPALILYAMAWSSLFKPGAAPPYPHLLAAQWIGRAVNTLLPVAQVGGEVVKARVICLWGADPVPSAASVVVDKTVQAVAAIVWGLMGVVLLAVVSKDDGLAGPLLGGLGILGLCVGGFLLVQRAGLFGLFARLGRSIGRTARWDAVVGRADEIDRSVRATYRRTRRVLLGCILRLLGLTVQTAEVWLAAYLLGHPIGVLEALMLKSLSSTLSDVAFVVPNSYGVQEGVYVLLGGLIGLAPEFMLALSLATRLRDVVIDIPGLIAWQHSEGRHFF